MDAADQNIFSVYKKTGPFSDIDYLTPANLNEQKEDFLENKIENPSFLYEIDTDRLKTKKQSLNSLYSDVQEAKFDQSIKQAYLNKITEDLNKAYLVEAVKNKEYDLFQELNNKIYGQPEEGLFRSALGTVFQALRHSGVEPDGELKKFENYASDDIESDFNLASSEDARMLHSEEIRERFQNEIKEIGVDWDVRISENKNSITLDYQTGTILIPKDREVGKAYLDGLIEHEIRVHLRRYTNGLKSPLYLLSLGLGAYLKGEEGLAMYFETRVNKSKLPGTGNYLATCLASGMIDGIEKKSFREVFLFLKNYNELLELASGGEINEKSVSDKSWRTCVKVFRGTDGLTSSGFFARELLYYKGFEEIKKIMNSNSKEVKRWLVGKYDPANSQHVELLNRLGM